MAEAGFYDLRFPPAFVLIGSGILVIIGKKKLGWFYYPEIWTFNLIAIGSIPPVWMRAVLRWMEYRIQERKC